MTASLHPPAGIPDGVPDLARFVGAVAAHINGGVEHALAAKAI